MTDRQKVFIDAYLDTFNATRAAIIAGYSKKTAYSQGQRLLKKAEIKNEINGKINEKKIATIADRQTRQKFWSSIMLNEKIDLKHRLRASELLAKSEGDFIERQSVEVQNFDLSRLSENELLELKALSLKATLKSS